MDRCPASLPCPGPCFVSPCGTHCLLMSSTPDCLLLASPQLRCRRPEVGVLSVFTAVSPHLAQYLPLVSTQYLF